MPPTQLCNYANPNFTLPTMPTLTLHYHTVGTNQEISKCTSRGQMTYWVKVLHAHFVLFWVSEPWSTDLGHDAGLAFSFPATIDIQSLLRVDVDYKCQYVTGWLQPGVYQGVFHNPWESRRKHYCTLRHTAYGTPQTEWCTLHHAAHCMW